jgi:gamma-glutamylcyclotransferase (GGCT)/AIG2-like uncharacterized protein YtfP
MHAIVNPAIPTLFAYGTLREPLLLQGVLGHPLEGLDLRPATAPGFRAVFYPGRIYPALVEAAGQTAEGLAVTGLSAADLVVLDLFEGNEYRRRAIVLEVEGKTVVAQFYWPVAAIGPDATAWSFAEWRRQHGEAMIVSEGETAATLRRQLIDMVGRGRDGGG